MNFSASFNDNNNDDNTDEDPFAQQQHLSIHLSIIVVFQHARFFFVKNVLYIFLMIIMDHV